MTILTGDRVSHVGLKPNPSLPTPVLLEESNKGCTLSIPRKIIFVLVVGRETIGATIDKYGQAAHHSASYNSSDIPIV